MTAAAGIVAVGRITVESDRIVAAAGIVATACSSTSNYRVVDLVLKGSEQALESADDILRPTNHLADLAALSAQDTLVSTLEAEHASLCILQDIATRAGSVSSNLSDEDVNAEVDTGLIVQVSEAQLCSHLLGVSSAALARRFVNPDALGVIVVEECDSRRHDSFDDLNVNANRFRGKVGGR